MLGKQEKYIRKIYVNIFRHVDKVNCLMPALAAFTVSKNACNEVTLLQKSGSGRPRLVTVVCSLKCFGKDLICWQITSSGKETFAMLAVLA